MENICQRIANMYKFESVEGFDSNVAKGSWLTITWNVSSFCDMMNTLLIMLCLGGEISSD